MARRIASRLEWPAALGRPPRGGGVRTVGAAGAALVVLLAASALVEAGLAAGPAGPLQIKVGGFPTGITVDPRSGTIYVDNGLSGTLSLINGRTCNAVDVRGCRQVAATVSAGTDPVGSAVDEATRTLYVASATGTVSVVNGRTCDVADRSGCRIGRVSVAVGIDPQFLAVDEKTDTLYVANTLSNTVSVIAGHDCNARSTRDCGRPLATIPVGPGPFALAVDDATGSIYVTDLAADTVSIIDAAACNAADVRGCRRRPVTVEVGQTPGGVALDPRTDTVYVTGESSDDVSVIDGRRCNATQTAGCRSTPVRIRAGAGARGIAIDEATDTLYVADTAADAVSVIDGSTCNARVETGCGQRPVEVAVGSSPRRVAVDAQTNTVYVTNAFSDTVTMLDGRTCDGTVHSGCGAASAPLGTATGGAAAARPPVASLAG